MRRSLGRRNALSHVLVSALSDVLRQPAGRSVRRAGSVRHEPEHCYGRAARGNVCVFGTPPGVPGRSLMLVGEFSQRHGRWLRCKALNEIDLDREEAPGRGEPHDDAQRGQPRSTCRQARAEMQRPPEQCCICAAESSPAFDGVRRCNSGVPERRPPSGTASAENEGPLVGPTLVDYLPPALAARFNEAAIPVPDRRRVVEPTHVHGGVEVRDRQDDRGA